MDKEDAICQALEQLQERRKQVVRLYKKGIKVMQIVAMTGLSYPTVRAAIDRFESGGWINVRPVPRGRFKGDGRVLRGAQEKAIQRMMIDQRPEQLKMDFRLWSRAAVGHSLSRNLASSYRREALASASHAGASRRKSRSSARTSKAPQRCKHGCKANIRSASGSPQFMYCIASTLLGIVMLQPAKPRAFRPRMPCPSMDLTSISSYRSL